MKLQEEEHQRKLVQDKANQVTRSSFVIYLELPLLEFFFTFSMPAILFVCSSATDRFGDQQDTAAVGVTSPVFQSVKREKVTFKGKELNRGGSRLSNCVH